MYHTQIRNIQILAKPNLFRFSEKPRYTKTMTYFQQDLFPQYETESSSLAMKLFSDFCCNGCSCQTQADHDTEFVLEEIDLEQ